MGQAFQGFPAFEEDAKLRAASHSYGKRRGNGQPHGARTGNYQYGDGVCDSQRQRVRGDEPNGKCDNREAENYWNKTELARSASRSMGAREPCACCTMRVICARTVASPSDSARQVTAPS